MITGGTCCSAGLCAREPLLRRFGAPASAVMPRPITPSAAGSFRKRPTPSLLLPPSLLAWLLPLGRSSARAPVPLRGEPTGVASAE